MYLEQYERVKRWYERLMNINNGIPHTKNSESYKDEVYAFFINCFHLKDWIKNDPSNNVYADKVEKFVNSKKNLEICRKICHGAKHLIIEHPKLDKADHSLKLGGCETIYSAKYEIEVEGIKYDAFKLATQCMNDWKVFLGI